MRKNFIEYLFMALCVKKYTKLWLFFDYVLVNIVNLWSHYNMKIGIIQQNIGDFKNISNILIMFKGFDG